MRVVRVVLVIIGLLTTFIIAELIYIIYNRPGLILEYFLAKTAKRVVLEDRVDRAYDGILNLAFYQASKVSKEYQEIEWIDSLQKKKLPDNQLLRNDLADYFQDLDYQKLASEDGYYLTGTLYRMGLLAYQKNELELTEYLWLLAVNVLPEWSYFHQEIANLFLSQNEVEKSFDRISFCLNFQYAQSRCDFYLKRYLNNLEPLTIGFYQDEITEDFINY